MTFTWPVNNFQIRYKTKTRFGISGFGVLLTSQIVRCVSITKRFLKKRHWDITWSGYNLQTRYKIRTKFGFSGSRVINLKLCHMYWHQEETKQMTLSWVSHDLLTIYRPGTKWGPDLVSLFLQILLTSNFVIWAGINNW